MSAFLRKYGTATVAGTHVGIPMIKAGAQDFAVGADWTPAAGDCKISIDSAAQVNITALPAYTNGQWLFQFTAPETTGKSIRVAVVDSATKAVEDQFFIIETYGNAAAMYQPDVSAANVPQTGDSFPRLGAPAGASIAADIAAVSTTLGGFSGPGFLAGTLSAVASATSVTFAVGSGSITAGMVSTWVGLSLYIDSPGRAPENLPISGATFIDGTHATLTFASPGFLVLPISGDVAYVGGTHG